MNILETARLALREFTLQDAAFIIELVNTPGWIAFIGDRNIHTREAAEAYLANGPLKSYANNGFGLSLVALKESGVPIGMCGLIKRDTLEHVDIGFAFLPAFEGNGYGYEIASATLQYARETLQLPKIVAITVPYNERSIRLLEKIGLVFDKKIIPPGDDEELLYYRTQ